MFKYMTVIMLITSAYIDGMDSLSNNHLDTSSVKNVEISLEGCAFCKQEGSENNCYFCQHESSIFCRQCEGVYYCSPGCKHAHCDAHQNDCHKIKLAQCGDLSSIEGFFQANVAQFKKTNKRKYLTALLKWHYRKGTRLHQDYACCNEPNLKSAVEKVMKRHMNIFKHLVSDGIIQKEDLNNLEMIQELRVAFNWAEQLAENDMIVSPYGVLQYSDIKSDELDQLFIPKDQWKSKRLETVKRNKAELTKIQANLGHTVSK